MISFFPEVYPDELLYSWLARYGVRTGYTNYRAIADDLFTSNTAKPNPEFLIPLSKDAYRAITASMTFEKAILNHTMFPYYSRFLSLERRQKAYNSLLKMDKSFNNSLYIRRNKTQHRQWLRYCPLCTSEDREKYGETYWHRLHQLDDIDICPTHGCYLQNSEITITSIDSPSLIHAETIIHYTIEAEPCHNTIEKKVAAYVANVFTADMELHNPITLGAFFHAQLEHTPYLSTRGKRRLLAKLIHDFNIFYRNLPNATITEEWQVEKIFSNHRCHTYDVCLLALFLGVPVSELVHMRLPEKSRTQLFDEQIICLHAQGKNYRQIADQLGASYDYCKRIGTRKRAYQGL